MTDSPTPLEPQQLPARKPYLPLGGFWARAGAFVVDLILLYLFCHLLVFLLKDTLFKLGEANVLIGTVAGVLYFTLLNGPVGKGITLGKLLAGVKTTNYMGRPLSFKESFIRSLVQLELPLLNAISRPVFNAQPPTTTSLLIESVFFALILIITIAYGFHLGFSPTKQAPHDLLVKSLVFKSSEVENYDEVIRLYPDESTVKRLKRTGVQSTLIFTVVVFGLLAYNSFKSTNSEAEKLRIEIQHKFFLEDYGYPVYFPVPVKGAETGDGQTAITSGGKEIRPPQKYKIRLIYQTYRDYKPDRVNNNELKSVLGRFKGWFVDFIKSKDEKALDHIETYEVAIIKQIPLVFYTYSEDLFVLEINAKTESK